MDNVRRLIHILLCRLGYCVSPSHRLMSGTSKMMDDIAEGLRKGADE